MSLPCLQHANHPAGASPAGWLSSVPETSTRSDCGSKQGEFDIFVTELANLREPKNGMHMIGHQYKTDASAVHLFQQFIEHPQHNPFRVVVVQTIAAAE